MLLVEENHKGLMSEPSDGKYSNHNHLVAEEK
jgi:hypothetical protein